MVRTRGRAPRGKRLVGRGPHGHWKITTFVAGLRCGAVTAPFVIDQPMNGVIFLTYIRRCLAPKAAGVREAIEAVGAKLRYLPSYSPDLNPIELLFVKLKALLPKAAEREIDALWTRIGKLLDAFTTHECAAYLRHAGYAAN
jgi:transposase